MIRRAILEAAQGDLFRKRVSVYIVEGLTKGIPSLFSDLKYLLNDSQKREIIFETVQKMRQQMEGGKTIDGDEPEAGKDAPYVGETEAILIEPFRCRRSANDVYLASVPARAIATACPSV